MPGTGRATSTTVTATTTSTPVLGSLARRAGATIQNEGPNDAYVASAATASVTAYTIKVAVGGYYEVPYSYTGPLSAVTAAGTAVLRVTEF